MDWLNYHHLLYFWMVAREGSISRACEKLMLAQPTISGQLRKLEKTLGEKLFSRSGRKLVLTETGRVVYRYADEIFALGREMVDTLRGRPTSRPLRLVVGVDNVLPKLIAYQLLSPALEMDQPVQIVCREDNSEQLFAELALHNLDVVLADAPLNPSVRILAYNHLLGECGTSIVAAPRLAGTYRRGFPRSLDGAPWLLPTRNTALRRALDQWFDAEQVRPAVRGEIGDSALLKAFGQHGIGVFAVPTAVEEQVQRQYGVRLIGRLEKVREQFYVISVERKLKHPAVVAISEAARQKLFG